MRPEEAARNLNSVNSETINEDNSGFSMNWEFELELSKAGGCSVWFSFVYVLMLMLTFAYTFSQAALLKISHNKEFRCFIPELEDNNWSFDEIRALSQPKFGNNCTYYNYNYGIFAGWNYFKSKEFISNIEMAELIQCKQFKFSNDHVCTIYEEFNLVCDRIHLEKLLIIAPVFGIFLSGLLIVPFADIYGRKRMIESGSLILFVITLLMPVSPYLLFIIMCRFMAGFAYNLMKIPIESLILEIANKHLQPHAFTLLNIGSALAIIATTLLASAVSYWRYLQLLSSVPFLFLPLIAWYSPESPRWFMSQKRKNKAWSMLKSMQNSVIQNEQIYLLRNENINVGEAFKNQFKNFVPSKFARQLLLLFFVGCLNFQNYIAIYEDSTFEFLIWFGLLQMISYFSSSFLLFFCKKLYVILLLFFLTGIMYSTAAIINQNQYIQGIILLVNGYTTSILHSITWFYVAENTSTNQRCTSLGFLKALGISLPTLMIFLTHNHLTTFNLHIIFAVLSLIGGVASFLFNIQQNNEE